MKRIHLLLSTCLLHLLVSSAAGLFVWTKKSLWRISSWLSIKIQSTNSFRYKTSHSSHVSGLPQYKDEYDYEYDDEELNNADDSEAGPVKQYSAKMRSENQRFDVVAGTTIRMRCDIDNLNSEWNNNPGLYLLIIDCRWSLQFCHVEERKWEEHSDQQWRIDHPRCKLMTPCILHFLYDPCI